MDVKPPSAITLHLALVAEKRVGKSAQVSLDVIRLPWVNLWLLGSGRQT
jgi:hypothetical protein